jgi:REP element-mobilizing transposase RayT
MRRNEPIAYFLTWRTYGTWLPGDTRGWVDEARNAYGEPTHHADYRREAQARGQMIRQEVTLGRRERSTVDRVVRETCAENGWVVHALNVRTNHVHLVVSASDTLPPRVMTTLKARSTRALAERGINLERPWARGGSHRLVWNELALAAVIDYVQNRQ